MTTARRMLDLADWMSAESASLRRMTPDRGRWARDARATTLSEAAQLIRQAVQNDHGMWNFIMQAAKAVKNLVWRIVTSTRHVEAEDGFGRTLGHPSRRESAFGRIH